MDYHFTAQYEECDGVIIATIPSLKGCVSYGYTLQEAEKNIQEALELYIEDLPASGEDIPVNSASCLSALMLIPYMLICAFFSAMLTQSNFLDFNLVRQDYESNRNTPT